MSVFPPDGLLPGEMAGRVRRTDWSKTPLGDPQRWSDSLRRAVALVLASSFPMAIRWGPQLVTLYNDAYRPILGDRHPQALGRPLREVWPEIYDDLGPLNEAILRGERPAFFAEDQLWIVERHGERREEAHFAISYSPILDETAANGIGGILCTAIDTTARAEAEKALRELTGRLGLVATQRTRERDRIWQVSEDLLGVRDFRGYFTSINPAWTQLLGWSEDEIRRMHVTELRHPDDAESADAAIARLAQGVPTVRMENRFRHKDGSWRWLHWTLSAEHGVIYVIGRHVTAEKEAAEALRQSEQQFRLLVAGVADHALFMLDPQGIVSGWNAGAERLFGYTQQEIAGQHFSRFYTASDRDAGVPDKLLARAVRTGDTEAEGWRVRKNGTSFWASSVIDAIQDDAGALIGFAKITRDITERREGQLALQRAQEQLSHTQKMEALGQLTGGIAHDFNNMLMVVSGNAQALKARLSEPRDRRAVQAIETAAAHGETLNRQLLAFSRRQSLNPVPIRLGEQIAAFGDVLASSIRGLDGTIKLAIDIPADVWPVAVDVAELELALVNVVLNARDAMSGTGRIDISARNVQLQAGDTPDGVEGAFVALSVADSGSGIPAEILPKVFEPFFTTKDIGKGTGLGLSQVYGFTRQSGGTVVVSSAIGRGTELTIYLPRSQARPAQPAPVAAPRAVGAPNATILLVEDNPDVQEIAATLLEQLGYRVQSAATGSAALNVLDSGASIDLVFSDLVMPGEIDGLKLAHLIRKLYPQLPVLLTTGYARAPDGSLGGFPILRKPYRMADLSQAVRQTLDQRRSGAASVPVSPSGPG